MFRERSPSRSASISRTGPLSTARVASSRRATAHIAFPIASSSAIDTIVAGSASMHNAMPTDGPSSHGPTSRVSSPASPLTPSPTSTITSSTGASPTVSPSSTVGSLSRSIPAIRQYVRLPSCSRTPRPGGGGGTGGMCEASSRFAWRRSPSANRHVSRAVPASSGKPIHSGASRTPSASPPPIRSRYVSPWPRPTTRYSSVRRAARRWGERSSAAAITTCLQPRERALWASSRQRIRAHSASDAPSLGGRRDGDVAAGGQGLDLERRVLAGHQPAHADVAGVALRVDRVPRGGDDGADVPRARAQLEPVGRALRRRRDVATVGDGAQREAAEAGGADPAGSRGDLHRGAHAREVHGAAGGLDHDRHVVGHGQPVAHVAGADHLLRAARDDAHGAVLHVGLTRGGAPEGELLD